MKIYVATKFENQDRAIEVASALKRAGHTITYEWWTNEQLTSEQALADANAVLDADALVVIAEDDLAYNGTLTEFGIAIGCGIPIYLIGNAIDNNIFTRLPYITRGFGNLGI